MLKNLQHKNNIQRLKRDHRYDNIRFPALLRYSSYGPMCTKHGLSFSTHLALNRVKFIRLKSVPRLYSEFCSDVLFFAIIIRQIPWISNALSFSGSYKTVKKCRLSNSKICSLLIISRSFLMFSFFFFKVFPITVLTETLHFLCVK